MYKIFLPTLLFSAEPEFQMQNPDLKRDSTVAPHVMGVSFNAEEWMKNSGVWDKCQDGGQIIDLLNTLNKYPEDRLSAVVTWMKDSGAVAKCQDGGQINFLLNTLNKYPEDRLSAVVTWMKDSGAVAKCQSGWQINGLLNTLKDYPEDRLSAVFTWMKDSGAMAKCQDEGKISALLNTLKKYPEDRLSAVVTWMKDSGAVAKCQSGWQIIDLLNILKDYPEDRLSAVVTWMKDSGAVAKCQDGEQIIDLLNTLKDYPEDRLSAVVTWMKDSGAMAKCQDGWQIIDLLNTLKDYPEDRLSAVVTWMKDSGAVAKCQDGWQINFLLNTLKKYPEDRLSAVVTWMKNSGVWDKCQDGGQIIDLLNTLNKYPEDRLSAVVTWMINSGAIAKCQDGGQIISLLNTLKDYPEDRLSAVVTWMINSGAIAKCQDGSEIDAILRGLQTFDVSNFDKPVYPANLGHADFYSQLFNLFPTNDRFKVALCSILENNPDSRTSILEKIMSTFGAESLVSQEFILFCTTLTGNPANSSFAVHVEIMTKRASVAEHNPQVFGMTRFNMEVLQESPAQAKPIHIPWNQWNGLFDKLQNGDQESLKKILDLFGVSQDDWQSMLGLRNNEFLRNLLDPMDSLRVNDYVGPLAQKFRIILLDILNPDNEDATTAFIQLLINVQTCPVGKEQGILNHYARMNNTRVLDEKELGTQGFIQEMRWFLQSELRRVRLAVISQVLRDNYKSSDPHALHYIQGVLEPDLGLCQTYDQPVFDIHACRDSKLRAASKQTLLDQFYQIYTPEFVIKRVTGMLNDGSIRISNSHGLTLKILNEFLSGEYFILNEDGTGQMNLDLVEINDQNNPVNFKLEAARRILVILGILKDDSYRMDVE